MFLIWCNWSRQQRRKKVASDYFFFAWSNKTVLTFFPSCIDVDVWVGAVATSQMIFFCNILYTCWLFSSTNVFFEEWHIFFFFQVSSCFDKPYSIFENPFLFCMFSISSRKISWLNDRVAIGFLWQFRICLHCTMSETPLPLIYFSIFLQNSRWWSVFFFPNWFCFLRRVIVVNDPVVWCLAKQPTIV